MKRLFFGASIVILTIIATTSNIYAEASITGKTFLTFSEAAGFEKRYDKMINIFISNFRQGMMVGFNQKMRDEDLPPEIKVKIYPMVSQAADNLKNNFERMFRNEVTFKDLVDKVYLPVYRKHFSENEIKQLIDFYNSPVGKKVSALTPVIMQESSNLFNQEYGSKVQELGSRLVKDELNSLNSKMSKLRSESSKNP
jgi:hypothetical protein